MDNAVNTAKVNNIPSQKVDIYKDDIKKVSNKNNPLKAKDMGKNEFLKILVTQLSHQDPLQPLEDKEFIAQMAQFTSLEQMMQINNNISKMSKTSDLNRAFFFLGKNVKVLDNITEGTQRLITGKVQEIDMTDPDSPGVMINSKTYKLEQIKGIITGEGNNSDTDKVNEEKK